MKKHQIILLLAVTGLSGILTPYETSKAWGDEGPMFTECFHVASGDRDNAPFLTLPGAATCPPCEQVDECYNSPSHNVHKIALEEKESSPNHTVNLPPSMCTEVAVEEW